MFDRFIRLARARKALREQRHDDALVLANDPLIAGDRRAAAIERRAVLGIVARAERRLAAGEFGLARADVERLRGRGGAEVEALRVAFDVASAAKAAAAQGSETTLAEVQRLCDRGELAAAGARLVALVGGAEGAAARRLDARIREQREAATSARQDAVKAAGDDRLDDALAALRRAEALDRDAGAWAATAAVAQALARRLDAEDDGLEAVFTRLAGVASRAPSVLSDPALRATMQRLRRELRRELAAASDIPAAARLGRAALASGVALDEPTAALCEALPSFGGDAAGRQANERAAAIVSSAARSIGADALAAAADAELARGEAVDQRLAAARACIDRGQLETARGVLVELLAEQPHHAAARRELDLVDESLAALERRLADVRLALRGGKLREAAAGALSLLGSPRLGAEAQSLLEEARARSSLVARGLDEIRVALHGRAANSIEGVRHCLKRLEELGRVQRDHEELPGFTAAVAAEVEALSIHERARVAVEDGDLEAAEKLLPELLTIRSRLLGPTRLDGRLCELGDRLVAQAERALAAGQLATVGRCAARVGTLDSVRLDFATRALHLRTDVERRRAEAERHVEAARQRLAERDLAAAEEAAEHAQRLDGDGAAVRALLGELQVLRHRRADLEQAEVLAAGKDYRGAEQKLAAMASVPPMLRTRVYDMKQDLARAQGLEGAFVLRVDEGGEWLVLRGETVVVGNVRQQNVDLPVLANLAGRHASLRRSMSFHGGMEDAVVAEDGEVHVGGRRVDRHVLRHGDRVQLGSALALRYERPSGRSLTSAVTLLGGFQVASTDRLLLMKDRGRDGRILLGPGKDVHVRVARAAAEVELLSNAAGQVRVACAAGGTIDGTPFRGEHPVAAGQVVEAGGVSFVLLPWRPNA
jgi:hypothetical protein